ALVTTTGVTYPFALLVSKLSRINAEEFQPCSHRACTFMKIFGSGMVPSTLQGPVTEVFDVVVNGNLSQSQLSPGFLSPSCAGLSAHDMRQLCDSSLARKRIINPLEKSWSRYIYVYSIMGWAFLKVLHDWLLLAGVHEFKTLCVGCLAMFFELSAVSAAFLWSMGAVEVFVAKLPQESCACYYVLPELEAILAIGTPGLLFAHAVKKLEHVHRATLVGDYLYFQQYDVPFRLAEKSGAINSGTCLVGSVHGYYHHAWKDQLDLSQLRCLHVVHQALCYGLFLVVVSVCVGIAIGPVTSRAIELLADWSPTHHGPVFTTSVAFLAAGLWFFPAFLLLRLVKSLPVDFRRCEFLPELWEYTFPWLNLLVRIAFILILGLCLSWATAVLTTPLVTLTYQAYHFDTSQAFRFALAGVVYFGLGVQMFVWIVYLIPTHRALFVKARLPYRPSSYIEIAENHPEFNLSEEVRLAKVFLKENRNPENLEPWQQLECFVSPLRHHQTSERHPVRLLPRSVKSEDVRSLYLFGPLYRTCIRASC
ncbi:unnamed protein product, partial [Effrenium voratum]